MNRTNLEKLASYLERLPEDYQHFHMTTYFKSEGTPIPYRGDALAGDCGTVACALGHGPAAGITIATEALSWADYSENAFELSDDEWEWCFSSGWVLVDNTPHGAAKRIRQLLDHKLPSNAWEQCWERAPYMF